MRRFVIGCSAAALLLAGGALAGTAAVHATTPLAEVHPIVGAWILTVEEFAEDPPSLVVFHADGTFHEANADGSAAIGSWEASGPSSMNLTFVEFDEEGPAGMIRAAGEVSEDGQTFTAEFSIEITGEGAPAGEYGPGHVTGTRINVEPMGTPAGSLEDLFTQFEEGTMPAGTEAVTTPGPEDTMVETSETGSSTSGECPPEPTVQAAEERLVGLSEEDATAAVESCGWILRVVRRNGEDLPVTLDFRANRVNVEVTDGEVTSIVNTG
jgi:hypothetical protein